MPFYMKEKMMRKLTINHPIEKVFVTSDTHFGHRMVSKVFRGFDNPDDHDRALVDNWNALVPEDGIVINFGDVSFTNKERTGSIIGSLNGTKYAIPGNHDNSKNLNFWFGENVLPQLLSIQVIDPKDQANRIRFEASHYPLAAWNGSDHGALHLHGHLHSRNNSVSHHFCAPYSGAGTRYDVGIDNAPFFGYSLSPIPLPVVREMYEKELVKKNARKPRAEREE
jgi:calcineurin-like phosphoesterase family protein